jgi:hypothetical protein
VNHRERFRALMNYEPIDRMPLYYFGTWAETKVRWREEGLVGIGVSGSQGPQVPGMDPDWEEGMWGSHGLVNINPISPDPEEVLEETEEYRIVRTSLGAVLKHSKLGSSIEQHIEEALQPTRASWERFKGFIDPDTPERRPPDWEAKAAALNQRERLTPFCLGSLFGWPRGWMGVEQLTYLSIDDPVLFEEIVDYLTEYYITLFRPVLEKTRFDFAYIFEDCCCKSGPLLSPATYDKHYAKYYRRLTDFCHEMGVDLVLLDSDGKVDALLPRWLDSGVDIVFPIEVGTWQANPTAMREQYGKKLRMIGGIDKHVIPQGETAIRQHLERLKPLAEEGGYLPMPDHRIPPDCSLDQFRRYLQIYQETF